MFFFCIAEMSENVENLATRQFDYYISAKELRMQFRVYDNLFYLIRNLHRNEIVSCRNEKKKQNEVFVYGTFECTAECLQVNEK